MFATANIRSQNPLKNEDIATFTLGECHLFSCEFFEWFTQICALLYLTAIDIDFLFIEFSFSGCLS